MGDVKGKTIAVLGLAFKPETDDMREAPALVVIGKLLEAGASVRVFDPIAMPECKRRIGNVVTYCENMYDVADGADALALMTEWRQFRMPTWNVIRKCMKGNVIVDGRNIYNRQELEGLGFVRSENYIVLCLLYENNKNKACMRMDFITSLSDTYFSLFFSSK